MKATATIGIVVTIALGAARSAPGSEWICGTNNWCTPTCWNPNGVPSGDTPAEINNGGTATIASPCAPGIRYVYLGYNVGNTGCIRQDGGIVTIENLFVGRKGVGCYYLNGGILRVDLLQIGQYTGSSGSFTQAAGTTVEGYLPSEDEYVEYLKIGDGTECNGSYQMDGGTLRAWHIRMGYGAGCTGTFTQNGGTVYNEKDGGAYLRLGLGYTNSGVPGRGTYTLNNSAILYSTKVHTFSGVATINQNNNATVVIAEDLLLVGSQDSDGPARATYTLQSGYLSADIEYIGKVNGGTGSIAVFNHNMGGTNEVNYLYIGHEAGAWGRYNIPILSDAVVRVGELHVGLDGYGYLDIGDPECHITVLDKLSFGPNCGLHVNPSTPGCPIRMNGAALDIRTTSESALADLIQVRLTFDGGAGIISDCEVAGEDRLCEGMTSNFALGHLAVGGADVGHLRLVDLIDNGNRGGPGGNAEALYVGELILRAGSVLDLNGLHLYCEDFTDEGGTVLNGAVAVMAPPVAPAAAYATPAIACPGGPVTLTAVGGSGGTVEWYAGTCGGTPVGSGTPLTITAPECDTTYFARIEGPCGTTGCVWVALPIAGPGDLDCDGDIDGGDLAAWANCAAGPGGALPSGCDRADLDGDGDTDLADFAVLQTLAGVPRR